MLSQDFEKAYYILRNYIGDNPKINYLKKIVSTEKYLLTDFDSKYIIENFTQPVKVIDKVVYIRGDFGQILQKKYDIPFLPTKILVKKMFGKIGDNFHCLIQYRKTIKPVLQWIKKEYIIEKRDESYKNIDIDFEKYDKLTSSSGRKIKDVQKDGIKFLIKNKRCILADSMGTGKTCQSTVAAMESGAEKVLIICPASLKSTWKRELMMYNDENEITIINGSQWKTPTKFTIINYDIIDNFYQIATDNVYEHVLGADGNAIKVEKKVKSQSGKIVTKTRKSRNKEKIQECLENSELFLANFGCVIVDECHLLSNNTSIRYKVISDLIKMANPEFVFLLTGTPLTNKPINLYHVLKLIDAEITRDYQYFVRRYCGAKKIRLKTGRTVLLTNGATHLEELQDRIKNLYIRRMLHEMTKMVNKDIQVKYYSLTEGQKTEYNKVWEEYVQAKEQEGKEKEDVEEYRKLVEGTLVRQLLASFMVEHTIKLVNEKINNGDKVIVMCNFTEEIEQFKQYYGDTAVVYDGKMTNKQKDKAEKAFMTDPNVKVFLGNIVSSSVGLTLTISNTVIFNSFSWVAATNKQGEDRVYRLNQTKDVEIIYQVFDDDISKNMFEKVVMKEYIMNEVIKSEQNK